MPSIGDACGMGHCHTSEEQGAEGGVCAADGGFFAVGGQRAGERLGVVRNAELDLKSPSEQPWGGHRLKPMPHVRVALLALRFYKSYLSFLFAGSCRFVPTCSEYSYQAIERFGMARGFWMTLKRLGRCQPFSGKFGFDPVPEIEDQEKRFNTEGTEIGALRARSRVGAFEIALIDSSSREIPCADVTHQEVHS
jgi:putative membrane protein insertion efficiency factor